MRDILSLLDIKGVMDPEYRDEMLDLIIAMDGTWLKWARKKEQEERDSKGKR